MATISIASFSEAKYSGRLDSEYFRPEFIEADKKIRKLNCKPLSYFVKEGYRVVYENTYILDSIEAQKSETRFLQASDIDTPEIIIDTIGFVNNFDWGRYKKGRVKTGEILIEVKGKAQKIAIVPKEFPEKTLVSGSLFKLTTNEKISREYLLIFLICKYGELLKNRLKTNLLISFIAKPDLYNIPIPVFPTQFQKEIEKLVNEAIEKLNTSKRFFEEANKALLSELNLADYHNTSSLSYVVNSNKVFQQKRIDAEYYQPKFETLLGLVGQKIAFKKLQELVSLSKGFEIGSDNYLTEGIPFIRVSNLTKLGIVTNNMQYISERAYKQLQKFNPKKGEILLTKDASIGTAYCLEEDIQAIISSGILRLKVKAEIDPYYLTLMLNSIVVQSQIERDAGGSIINHWKPEQVKNTAIPIIDINKQKRIGNMVKNSLKERFVAQQLFNRAKKIMEEKIDESS